MTCKREPTRSGEDGIALITTLLVVLVVGALVMGAIILGSNHILVDRYWARQSNLVGLADAGLEVTRSYLNGDTLFPDSGFVTVENGVSVQDGEGEVIPGVQRWTYVGPTGITSGQYGVFGSIVSVVKDNGGGVSVRRQQVFQESFAKFAYFTDNEGGNIYFASQDNIWGPLHTNDKILIHYTGANFWDEVTTAQYVSDPHYANFNKGYTEYSPIIPMPETADLVKLRVQGQAGNTAFTSDFTGNLGDASMRIEFIAVDLNQNGTLSDDDEGFFRVYQATNTLWVAAKAPTTQCGWVSGRWMCATNLTNSPNCGDVDNGQFYSAADHTLAINGHNGTFAVTQGQGRQCFLGGDERLFGGQFQPGPDAMGGSWLPWNSAANPRPVDSRLRALRPADADYLFPITRPLNPDFKGVIFVTGKVIVSGQIRGRVTIAATGNIIFGDDITYVTGPGAGTCDDIAGYFSADSVVMSDNTLNAAAQPALGWNFRTWDNTADEFFHGVVMALGSFTAENFNTGSQSAQPCQGRASGRGCIFLTGGIIQDRRGAVGLTNGAGYIKRYSYDRCAATQPPPYFPTTGVFVKGQYYQVDPAGFDIEEYFALIAPGTPVSTGN